VIQPLFYHHISVLGLHRVRRRHLISKEQFSANHLEPSLIGPLTNPAQATEHEKVSLIRVNALDSQAVVQNNASKHIKADRLGTGQTSRQCNYQVRF